MNAAPRPPGLARSLRTRTQPLHARAERSGIVAELLHGRGSRAGYALLLRNLLPAYQRLEQALERTRDAPGLAALAQPALYRAARLAADLEQLAGDRWQDALPLLSAGQRYAAAVAAADEGTRERLVAHAYVRYLGDLSGGRVLGPLLARSLGLPPAALSFYDFPGIADPQRFKAAYRDAIDRSVSAPRAFDAVLAEAELAFRLNIEVSEAVQARVAGNAAVALADGAAA